MGERRSGDGDGVGVCKSRRGEVGSGDGVGVCKRRRGVGVGVGRWVEMEMVCVWDRKKSNPISSFNPDLVDCELHIFDPPLEKSSGHEERLHDTP